MKSIENKQTELLIDAINITLPNSYEYRADDIARLLGKQLSYLNMDVKNPMYFTTLNITGIHVSNGESNGVIAGRIAKAIKQKISTRGSSDVS